MDILLTLGAIVACVALFSFAIFIHEFGHFLAAKWLGFRVERFSIGFGPALWKKTIGGVEYRISALPLGGYVALPDLDPEGTKALEGGVGGPDAAGCAVPAWKKIVVAFAGPFGNVVLAVALAFGLAAAPGARFGELSTVIGYVPEGGPAHRGGLCAGDRVVAVNGHAISSWSGLLTEVQLAGDKPAAFRVERAGATRELVFAPEKDATTGAYYILALSTTNSAKCAAWMPARNPFRQLAWDVCSIARVLKALVTPREAKSAARALGGPVMIAEGLYHQVRNSGWDALGMLRFLNVNLAMLNLLPIPVLDGGLILFALFELLFRRKMPRVVVDWASRIFLGLFLALFAVLMWRDVARSVRIRRAQGALEGARQADGQAEEASVAK